MKLNPEQKKIVFHGEGPLAVIANPGTGKTRCIVERTVKLIEGNHAKDRQILLITFTNKAKNEMAERLKQKLGKNRVNIFTFHSFGSRLLREHGSTFGFDPKFTIVDENQTLSFLKSHWESAYNFPKIKVKSILYLFNDFSNYDLSITRYLEESLDYDTSLKDAIEDTYYEYEKWKAKNNLFDLGDLQKKTLDLINKDTDQTIANKYKFIMVDEFQDTNNIQLELIKKLGIHNNVLIVGDMRQGIYAWRGAEPKNIQYFIDHFKSEILNLTKNYRSQTKIIKAYNSLIKKSSYNFGADTESTTDKPGYVKHFHFEDDQKETMGILKMIDELKTKAKVKNQEIAILYRANTLSKQFEDYFRMYNIPYKLIGSHSFYDRREVQDILSIFKWFYNPKDILSLSRLAKMARCGVGDKTISQLYGVSLKDKEEITLDSFEEIKDKQTERVKQFIEFLISIKDKAPYNLANAFLTEYKVLEKLKQDDQKNHETRLDNVKSILNHIQDNSHWDLEDILENYSVEKPKEDGEEENAINLMTIHKSKGLEFRAIFLVGLDEKILPHEMSMEEEGNDLEEERRAVYVGLSRAKEFLVCTSCSYRKISYNKEFYPSRYLNDIDFS